MWKFRSSNKNKKKIIFVGNDGFRDFELAENLSVEMKEYDFIYVSENINQENVNKTNSKIKKEVKIRI